MDNLPVGSAALENGALIDTIIVAQGVQHVDSTPFVVLPNGFGVQNLEKMLSSPMRTKGTAVMLDAESFIIYFNVHKTGSSNIYAMVEPSKFVGVLDDDSPERPGWREHVVTYSCPLSKEWMTWIGKAGQQMNQIAFAEFIEANLFDIHAADNSPEPTPADMLEVANNFRVQKKVNFASAQLLSNGQVDFKYQEDVEGTAGANGTIKVPERFYIAIPVFEGGSPYRIEAKLRWRLETGKLAMWFDLVREHKTLKAAFDDIWTDISDKTETTIFRGIAPISR